LKKACVYMLLILMLGVLVSGCSMRIVEDTTPEGTSALVVSLVPGQDKAPAQTTPPKATEAPKPTDPPVQPQNAPADTPVATPTEPPASEPKPTIYLGSTVPYLLEIDRADQSIYNGPGYDHAFADTVGQRGSYTIVEEQWDNEGNLWGKLKSGAGWVDVSQILSREYTLMPISVNFADENLLLHGDYYHCVSDSKEYCIPVAFRAYEKLRDVALFAYDFGGEGYAAGADFFTLKELTPEMPLVAELAFPGDMTMYGIRFTDEDGKNHIYSIYISGRNGSLVLGKHQ